MSVVLSNGLRDTECVAFEGCRLVAAGKLGEIALKIQAVAARQGVDSPQIIVFDARSSRVVELDLRGGASDVLGQFDGAAGAVADVAPSPPSRGPGRPKLGVVAREVTLLPRHWEWLAAQPGGASVALRKLVEQARQSGAERDSVRFSQEACYKFMLAMAGDCVGFEEANRALFAGDRAKFEQHTEGWPADVCAHARVLAGRAFVR